MAKYNLSLGQEIFMKIDSVYLRDTYKTSLLALNEDTLELSIPYHKGKYIPVNAGFRISLNFGNINNLFIVRAQVVERRIVKGTFTVRLLDKSQEVLYLSPTNTCKFITVSSGKGGVGKSVFVVNYALALVEKGYKVAVIDADLGMSNLDVLLNLCPRYNLIDVIEGERLLESIIIDGPGGLSVIPGGSGFKMLGHLSSQQFGRITAGFEFLEKNFDYVIIDTSAGLSENVTTFIYTTDETIILTTPEPHAITDAYSIIKVILDNSRDVCLKLIVNRCESPHEGLSVANKIRMVTKKFLEYDLLNIGYIIESSIVGKSIRKQTPFFIRYPNSLVSNNIRLLADNELEGKMDMKNIVKTQFITKLKQLIDTK